MAMLDQHLSTDPIFDIETQEFGRLLVERLTIRRMVSVEKLLNDKRPSPSKLIDILIASLARTTDRNRLTLNQVGRLSQAEKEDFAEQLALSNKNKDENIPRNINESAIDYFHRCYMKGREKIETFVESMGPSVKGLASWTDPTTLHALMRNAGVSADLTRKIAEANALKANGAFSLATSLKGLAPKWSGTDHLAGKIGTMAAGTGEVEMDTPPRAPSITMPPNSALETNKLLDSLIARFGRFEDVAMQTVELVQSMNTAASGLLKSFAEGAISTERFARRSIWIAIIALLVAIFMPLFQIGYDIWKSRQQDSETSAIVQKVVRQLTEAQQHASDDIRRAMTDQSDRAHSDQAELAKALSSLSDAIRTLRERPSVGATSNAAKGTNSVDH
ncbi:MAG: hypothetical protein J0H14_27540 [Alphaproteobacteria bacterium]|nr:hypothetical protein [Alphaproteobacteria bacterium]